jgi:pantoate kinase
MDNYASGGIGAGVVVALGIAYRVYLAVNHHRVRSNCCGKELVVSVDVETTTPPQDLKINVPKEIPEGKA